MQGISTTTFDIFVSGKHSELLYLERCIRQGDPISTYIFIICVEYLSHSIHFASIQPQSDNRLG